MWVCGRARSKGFAVHEVGEIRAEAPLRDRSGDGVAIDAGSGFEDVASRAHGVQRLSLCMHRGPAGSPVGRGPRAQARVRSERHFGLLGIREGWLGVPEPWRQGDTILHSSVFVKLFFCPSGKPSPSDTLSFSA